jgi:hypothetical protein
MSKETKMEEVTVTFRMYPNVKHFLEAYSKLLKYPSLEAFLSEELHDHYFPANVGARTDFYFNGDIKSEIMRRHCLTGKGAEE